MLFGRSSRLRFLCIDIQVDQVYFVVVARVGDFFEIDYSDRVVFEDGVFESSKVRTPAKFADTLAAIKKKFGAMQVITSIPEEFCYATLLAGHDYTLSDDVKKAAKSFTPKPAYVWKHTFHKNQRRYTALHVAQKEVCDFVFSLIKNTGYTSITMYPRALALTELDLPTDTLLCDFGPNQITLLTTHNAHAIGFSTLSYGNQDLIKKIKARFSFDEAEAQETLQVYGTDALLRKEAHVLNGIIYSFFVPVLDEIHSLELRRGEYGFVSDTSLVLVGDIARYEGLVADLAHTAHFDTEAISVWANVINFETHIPSIHKQDSYQYAGIAGLMNVLKNGTSYEPFDLI